MQTSALPSARQRSTYEFPLWWDLGMLRFLVAHGRPFCNEGELILGRPVVLCPGQRRSVGALASFEGEIRVVVVALRR